MKWQNLQLTLRCPHCQEAALKLFPNYFIIYVISEQHAEKTSRSHRDERQERKENYGRIYLINYVRINESRVIDHIQ